MENTEVIESVVKDVWTPEYKFAGKGFTKRIIEAAENGQPKNTVAKSPGAGDSFDLASTIHIIYEGALLASVILNAIIVIRKELKRKPTDQEVENAIKSDDRLKQISLPVAAETLKVIAKILKILDHDND